MPFSSAINVLFSGRYHYIVLWNVLFKLWYSLLTDSYFFEDERGLFPEIQFVYDLVLPQTFHPINSDGEVDEFYCWPIDKVWHVFIVDDDKNGDSNVFQYNAVKLVELFLLPHTCI